MRYRKDATMRKTEGWQRIRPTRLHSFNAARTEARTREGNVDWVCVKTQKGWFRTDEYTYAY
jgi:very-short-patch-repair endonuclease